MPKTDHGESHKSDKHTSPDDRSAEDRMVTDNERADLIEDAKAFKSRHKKTFRILSEGVE